MTLSVRDYVKDDRAACAMVCPDYVIRVYREAKKAQKEDKS